MNPTPSGFADMALLEVCVDNLPDLLAAIENGADRIELCSALAIGGLTPSAGLIAEAVRAARPVHVLIRPREGDFHYGERESAIISDDIARALDLGAAGIVIGAGGPNGLDGQLLEQWILRARTVWADASITLHRVFDLCSDLGSALEQAIELGFDRVLTSGGSRRAADAVATLAGLHRQAGERITVMAGSGIDATNVEPILAAGIKEVHASCGAPYEQDAALVDLGFAASDARRLSTGRVQALRQSIDRFRSNHA
jgi:copper homeostasis protein CutC